MNMNALSLSDIREDYRKASLHESEVAESPFGQFRKWFEEVMHSELQVPNAMTLATATPGGRPSARIVLLKGFDEQGFCFFTNYESRKAEQLESNPQAALVFFWPELERQVRLEGSVQKTTAAQSDAYFKSRPAGSRLSAWASPQSRVIPDRSYLEEKVDEFREKLSDEPAARPAYWGGYVLKPIRIEFWQGRSNRLHDRILYSLQADGSWRIERLAP